MTDKSSWGPGPWQNEPNKLQWTDEATELPCLIVRNSIGALCGYVGVPKGHPFYEKDYNDVPANVHGELTYSNHCDEDELICHVPSPGEPDDVWWLGFDCCHCMDKAPGAKYSTGNGTYRDIAYVKAECTSLAKQFAGAKP